jgi:hypothetical protein
LVARRDGVWLETDRLTLTESGRHPASLDGYPVPARLDLAGVGLRGRIVLGRPLVDHDPLAAVPLPFRWLLSLRTAPRQLWLDAELELTWTAGAGSLEMSGPGLVSVTFTNPLGSETPSP